MWSTLLRSYSLQRIKDKQPRSQNKGKNRISNYLFCFLLVIASFQLLECKLHKCEDFYLFSSKTVSTEHRTVSDSHSTNGFESVNESQDGTYHQRDERTWNWANIFPVVLREDYLLDTAYVQDLAPAMFLLPHCFSPSGFS